MSTLYFSQQGGWPSVDHRTLRDFVNELDIVGNGDRWSGGIIDTFGRMYFFRDHPDYPDDDVQRRCRAYFDLTDPGVWHVSTVPVTAAGDESLMLTETWYQWYKDRAMQTGVISISEEAAV